MKHPWKDSQIKILAKEVKKSPDNIQNALRNAATKLNKTPNSCHWFWYRERYTHPLLAECFVKTDSYGKVVACNSKNIWRETPPPKRKLTKSYLNSLSHEHLIRIVSAKLKEYDKETKIQIINLLK